MTNSSAIYSTHRYWVELLGITEGFFTECSGLQSELEVFDWEEGGNNGFVHRLPGRVKSFPNLVLKRGIVTTELWEWYKKASEGTFERQNLSIHLYGYDDMPTVHWDIEYALPVKWVGPSFKSDSREVAVESIELIHKGFTRR